jgi:hypothetical protein
MSRSTEQNIGVRNCAVELSSAQDQVNYHNPGFREQLMKVALGAVKPGAPTRSGFRLLARARARPPSAV